MERGAQIGGKGLIAFRGRVRMNTPEVSTGWDFQALWVVERSPLTKSLFPATHYIPHANLLVEKNIRIFFRAVIWLLFDVHHKF